MLLIKLLLQIGILILFIGSFIKLFLTLPSNIFLKIIRYNDLIFGNKGELLNITFKKDLMDFLYFFNARNANPLV